jgi:hypothetical protein
MENNSLVIYIICGVVINLCKKREITVVIGEKSIEFPHSRKMKVGKINDTRKFQ